MYCPISAERNYEVDIKTRVRTIVLSKTTIEHFFAIRLFNQFSLRPQLTWYMWNFPKLTTSGSQKSGGPGYKYERKFER